MLREMVINEDVLRREIENRSIMTTASGEIVYCMKILKESWSELLVVEEVECNYLNGRRRKY